MVDWKKTPAAIYRAKKDKLKPIFETDPIILDDLINIDDQKKTLFENTKKFVKGKPAAHALIWGSRGTGKSSLIKAILNHFFDDGLRLIEFFKDDLDALVDISDEIKELPYKFIVFSDDLSFDLADSTYNAIKSIIEGSIELPPKNILIYATSNRRHLVPEYFSDNDGTVIDNGEIHYKDNVEEKISLSDRFGLWIPFYQGNTNDYLRIIDSYFPCIPDDKREKLYIEAKKFSSLRGGSKSGRTAKQFYILYNDLFQ
ncbi:MAG: ATP-binding protein [Methanobrevibacter sp.]|jgi:predicted AAA+ superfamily ATPase|nr:ATP-binding protein [Candidatus Methanovirga basalitermitum]